MVRTPSLTRATLGVVASLSLLAPAGAALGASASLTGVGSSATLLHHPGAGTGTPFSQALAIQGTSSPTIEYTATRTFTGGTTKGKAGVGRNQSSTIAKLVFPTGIGVDQTDPGHVQGSSVTRIDFVAIFDIVGSGSFGPSINGVFSIPFGATIGAGGSAEFQCHVDWDAKIIGQNGNNFFSVRPDYDVTPGNGGLFNNNTQNPMNVLTSFTAPSAPFSPSSIVGGVGNQLRVQGFVQFAANNDNAPVTVDFPRDAADGTDPNDPDPYNLFQASTPDEEKILLLIPETGFEVDTTIPEPACGAVVAMGALLMSRRRRRQA